MDLRYELNLALLRHENALAEYRRRVEANDKPDELEDFHSSVVVPTLVVCERLAAGSLGEETRLVEQLRQCHEECVEAAKELRNPGRIIFFEEYKKLAEKAKVHQAKCHEVRLALRKHRKESEIDAR
jgi:hypothetical protein